MLTEPPFPLVHAQGNSYDFCSKASSLSSIMILFLILGWGALLIKVFKSSYNYYETLVFVHRNIGGV